MFEYLSNFKQNVQIKVKEELTLYIRISCFIPRLVIDFLHLSHGELMAHICNCPISDIDIL